MAITTDIVATYRAPARVFGRILARGVREDRALATVMGGCLVAFVAQWPRLSREAFLTGQELNALLGGALLGLIFILPLALYALAFAVQILARAVPGVMLSGHGSRIALFWSFLAASPLMLLHGMTAGFIGPGPALTLVGVLWFAVFLWFWGAGLVTAARVAQETA